MWAALIGLAVTLLGKLFGGGKDKALADARELGRAEQQNADSKADMAVVKAANTAAKQAAQEPFDAPDPNDRDQK